MKSEDLQESLNSLRDVYMPADRDREISAHLQQEIARHRARRSRFARVLWFRQWGAVSAAIGIAVVLVAVLVPWRGTWVNGQRAMQTASSTSDTAVLQSAANSAHVQLHQSAMTSVSQQSPAIIVNHSTIMQGPAGPMVETFVEQPDGNVRSLTVHVNIEEPSANWPQVLVRVASASKPGSPYQRDYPVTNGTDTVRIAIPPASGEYTVGAVFAKSVPSVLIGPPTTFFVDYGGLYRTGELNANLVDDQGTIAATVGQVVMTPIETRVDFALLGKDFSNGLKFAGNIDRATETLANGQTVDLWLKHAGQGPMPGASSDGELVYGPVQSSAKELTVSFVLLVGPKEQRTQPFVFHIPLHSQAGR